MNLGKWFLLSLLSLSACAPSDNHSVNSLDTGIVGGTLVSKGSESSKLVVLVRGTKVTGRLYDYSICSGAFIADNVVLTAAHCFEDATKVYDVVLETSLPQPGALERKIEIESVIIPETYKKKILNSQGASDDVALVKLKKKKPADFQTLLLPLGWSSAEPFKIQALGYGRTTGVRDVKMDGQGAGVLRHVEVTAVLLDPSLSYIDLDQTKGKGICNGDSGGPGVLKIDDKYYVVGVAKAVFSKTEDVNVKSAEDPKYDVCAHQGAYLNVQYYRNWIEAKLKELTKAPGLSSDVTVNRGEVKK